jgi:uncharacterized membrane protein (UPF0127 family)
MSNETPKAGTKKIASAPKRSLFAALVLIWVGSLVYLTFGLKNMSKPGVCPIFLPHAKAGRIDQLDSRTRYTCVNLEIADTPEARQTGLSGRSHMAETTGMLFVFEEPQTACIWMKDMHFNIDIVWLNDNKKITAFKKDVAPDTYPESFCQDDTRYVIELLTGTADKAGLHTGQLLNI